MELLDKIFYERLTNHLKQVRINNLFARSVIEKKISGQVYVDNFENPKTFYVVHPYGMSLLFGDSQNTDFNNKFLDYSLNTNKIRDKYEWMQAYPSDWDKVLSELYGNRLIKAAENKENKVSGIIELNTRINFKFNREKYIVNKKMILPPTCAIVQTDKKIYEEMIGSVIPSYFWDSADDFINNGIGFSLLCNKKLAATAYSAFIHDNKLELGIETIPEFHGKGFAQLTCSALINYCIEKDYEPIWACRLENTGSYKLAEKLGFEVYSEIPYYRLSN
ncbi:MAG: GNAT family N-acetyltransferase [Bacteroidetes bacterium HGW-Bacteroidetes-16]|jgi:GNAT superfamily N-acetyltransferase|nr:MAG: GNAT family N-acetyltransferase [Bacteroidetes bacterium HGW-Bacteroidetes-16]